MVAAPLLGSRRIGSTAGAGAGTAAMDGRRHGGHGGSPETGSGRRLPPLWTVTGTADMEGRPETGSGRRLPPLWTVAGAADVEGRPETGSGRRLPPLWPVAGAADMEGRPETGSGRRCRRYGRSRARRTMEGRPETGSGRRCRRYGRSRARRTWRVAPRRDRVARLRPPLWTVAGMAVMEGARRRNWAAVAAVRDGRGKTGSGAAAVVGVRRSGMVEPLTER